MRGLMGRVLLLFGKSLPSSLNPPTLRPPSLPRSICADTSPSSKMTDVYEGSLIRLFRRLEELLRQVAQAAKVMGSEELEQKFEVALGKVRRDIVAAQSLYL
jgi:hypothetical protein